MKNNSESRRSFLHKAVAGTAITLAIPGIVTKAFAASKPARISLSKDDRILFQGDSITDARRKKDDKDANSLSALGSGYAFLAAAELLFEHPGKTLNIYNKGISGNKVYQLAERWDADCLDLKPTVLSILIGVNDFWHTLVNGYAGTVETYTNDYNKLLERTREKLPSVKLIIGEPFALKDVKAVDDKWYPAFDAYRKAAYDIARNFDAMFVPYQSVFNEALKHAPGSYWTTDGVHPTLAGAKLMAHAWLESIKNK